jgi:CIC family chloride channel protein
VQPAVAGLLIGAIALRFPQVLGAGYESIDQAMHDQFGWRMLALLCILKLLATTTSFATGTPGGLFAPTLFMGAMLGGAVCAFERTIAPGVTGPIGAYALIGMGTMFAGILRAPMTSVFMVVEVSGNYSIILPVMISNTIAYLVSRQFQQAALFDLLARQEGTDLPSMEEEREAELLAVEDAMRDPEAISLHGDESVSLSVTRAAAVDSDYFLVPLDPGTWGAVSRADLKAWDAEGKGGLTLATCVTPIAKPYLYPDQSMDMALRVLRKRPVVPAVHRANHERLVGMLALEDILRMYQPEADLETPP